MNLPQLNSLFQEYRRTRCPSTFRELYEGMAQQKSVNRRMVVRSGYGDAGDAERIFDDTLLRIVEQDGIEDFVKAFAVAVKNRRLDFFRSEKRRNTRYYLTDFSQPNDVDEETPNSYVAVWEETPEDVNERKMKRDQQRQLLISLHESAKIQFDSKMVAATEELPRFNPEALAKALGVARNTVARKFERLSKAYDRNVHGNLADVLPSSIRIRAEFLAG